MLDYNRPRVKYSKPITNMPLTAKGKKIMKAMKKEYGEKGENVFYASKNKGIIKGVEKKKKTK